MLEFYEVPAIETCLVIVLLIDRVSSESRDSKIRGTNRIFELKFSAGLGCRVLIGQCQEILTPSTFLLLENLLLLQLEYDMLSRQ